MKRFDFEQQHGELGQMREDVDGEWIRYSDHVEAMKRIAAPSASAQQAEPVEWQIEVAGPAGYVRFETFMGETLEAALDSVRKQNFCPAPDEDGFVTMKVKV